MKQILVTVDTNQPLQNIRKAINMLRGVVSTTVVKEPILTKTQKQQAFVKESLTRALQEVKLAKLEGRKLPDARDLLKVFTTPSVPLVGDRNVALNRCALRLAGHQSPRQVVVRDGTAFLYLLLAKGNGGEGGVSCF